MEIEKEEIKKFTKPVVIESVMEENILNQNERQLPAFFSWWQGGIRYADNIDKNGNRSLNGVPNLKWTYHGKLKYIDYSSSSPAPQPRKLVAELQEVLNKQYGCGLAVDNSFGPLTTKACMNNYLYLGKNAKLHVFWMQSRLKELGYDLGKYGIDSSFGNDTLRAVKQFQKDRGLVVDGYVGSATHKELVK